MSAWLAVRQAVAAMDAVEKHWARELKLRPPELTVVLLLIQQPNSSAKHLAYFSGQRKQNVWRTLLSLEKRGLIHPCMVSKRGAEGWSLSLTGLALARRLEVRLKAWETIMQRRVDLDSLAENLQRAVELLINRPSEDGWEAGLLIPLEARLDPNWDKHLDETVLPVEERWVKESPQPAQAPSTQAH